MSLLLVLVTTGCSASAFHGGGDNSVAAASRTPTPAVTPTQKRDQAPPRKSTPAATPPHAPPQMGTCTDTADDAEAYDIRQISLLRRGVDLRVTWAMSTTVNLGSGTVGFSLNLSSRDGRRRGQASVTFANGEQSAFSIQSLSEAKPEQLNRKAEVSGSSVSASFPMEKLAAYGLPFRYSGATTLDGETVDACPDADKTTGDIAYQLFTGH